jgi:hypothetical protein
MKNMIKALAIIAFAAVIGFTFAACDNGTTGGSPTGDPNTYTGYDGDGNQYQLAILKTASNPVHTHTFSATWSSNATQHWRECTANDGEKTDVANHTFNGNICSVCNYNNGGGGGGNGLTITGLPNGMYTLWIFEAGTNVSDLSAINAALDAGKGVAEGQNLGSNLFLIFGDSDTPTIWKGSGNLPVVLHNNDSARYATVNFINGNATVPFSSFTLVGGGGGGHTHTYSSTWSSNATQHWRECIANDGATTAVGSHTGNPCTVCGYSSGGGPVHTHTWGEMQCDATQHWRECIANDGAKTDEGSHTGDPCNVCGYSSSGPGNRDSRLINWADDVWIDSYPPGDRDGFIFKENGTFLFIDDYTVTWGDFAVVGEGTWSTSGDNRLSLFVNAAYEAYSETYSYFIDGTDLTLTNDYGYSEAYTKTEAAVSGRSVGFTAPAKKAGTKAVTGAIKRAASLTADRAAAKGDKFTLTMKNASGATVGTSTGTVDAISGNGETLTLDHNGGKFTTKIKGQAIAELPDPIPLDDGGTLPAPGTLTPTKPNNPDPGIDSDWKWTAVSNSTIWSYAGAGYTIWSNINAIAYGNNRFVAVGEYSTMAYSDDGESWTAVEGTGLGSGASISTNAVAYGNGKFVAVGDSGQMKYSDDGISWTTVTAANRTIWEYTSGSTTYTTDIEGIAYGNNRFVAVGWRGKMAYSTDGINWTAVSDSKFPSRNSDDSNSFQIKAIAYGNNRFVAGGSDGKMAYSSDGASWTAVANSTFGTGALADIEAIAYGNNRFVAVSGNRIAYSTDGASWTAVSNSTFSGYSSGIYAIAYGNNRFVAGGSSGKIAYSSDGASWTAVLPDTDIQTILGIAYGNNRFVAVGWQGKMAYADW